jgi:hypothetical protein
MGVRAPKQAEEMLRAQSTAASVPSAPMSVVQASASALEPNAESAEGPLEGSDANSHGHAQAPEESPEADQHWHDSATPSGYAGARPACVLALKTTPVLLYFSYCVGNILQVCLCA